MHLEVGKLLQGTSSFVLLTQRWVVERAVRTAQFRRPPRDDEQLAETLPGSHVVAFAILMLRQLTVLILQSA
jgi:transposase